MRLDRRPAVRRLVPILALSALAPAAAAQAVPAGGASPAPAATGRQAPVPRAWRPFPELHRQNRFSVAYDPVRQRGLLYGGHDRGHFTQDTWEWDGTRWQPRTPRHSPGFIAGHKMAFDRVRRRILMFGGGTLRWSSNGTWTWDGRDWQRLRPAESPPGRQSHAMAADPVRGRIVLFGGAARNKLFGDTWEWDGTNWHRMKPAHSPPPRARALMGFDAARNRVVLYGGRTLAGTLPSSRTWEWDGRDWTAIPVATSPRVREGGSAVADPVTGGLLIQGGVDSAEPLYDTWRLDGTTWTDVTPASAPPPHWEAPGLFGVQGRVLRFAEGETWQWDGADWTQVEPRREPFAGLGFGVYDQARDEILIVGSRTGAFNATWRLRGHDYTRAPSVWSNATGSLALEYHAPTRTVFFQLGNEVWLWDGQAWRYGQTLPGQRFFAFWDEEPAYDSLRHQVVYVDTKNRVFEVWDGTKTWRQVPFGAGGPTWREDFSLAFDPRRDRLVLYGGIDDRTLPIKVYDEVWEWDGTRWTDVTPAVMPAWRSDPLLEYTPALGGLVMLSAWGKNPTPPQHDAWVWDGQAWRALPFGAPTPARFYPASLVYDSGRQRLLAIHGWEIFGAHEGVWELDTRSLTASRRYPRPGESVRLQALLPDHAGQPFWLALSGATRPGIPLRHVPGVGPQLLPLAPDALFFASLQTRAVATLDGDGRARFQVDIPNNPALWWTDLWAAGWVPGAGGQARAISNAVPLQIIR